MNIGILVSTRNRPSHLDALLASISQADPLPDQIVVSSSGVDISQIISKHSRKLSISHVHTDLYGQIRQKMLGIRELEKWIDWTIFLDDDVLLQKDTIAKLKRVIESRINSSSDDLLGVGLNTPMTSHLTNQDRFKKVIAKYFFLEGKPRGTVLKSGHPVSYLGSNHVIETQWLNGISAWKSQALSLYGSDYLESRYSAFEDVIFSYTQSKLGKLIYAPEIEVEFQLTSTTDLSHPSIFEAASYWRLKFILDNQELSKIKYLWAQIGRSAFFILSSGKKPTAIVFNAFKSFLILFEIVFQLTIKKNANWSLDRHCKAI